jgi:Zn-dependent protease
MDRRPRNRHGHPVDPVPFVVVAGLGGMLALSVGPLYGLAYGLSLRVAFVASGVATLGLAAGAYHQFVWRASAAAVPTDVDRLRDMALALGAVFLALSLPLI